MNIAVDLDDSLVDTISQLVLFHNDRYGTCLKKEDFNSCDYTDTWGGTRSDNVIKIREFFKSNYFRDIAPVAGAQEALTILKEKGHNLFIVTGRENHFNQITYALVEKYFFNIFSGIYHTNAYSEGLIRIKKSTVCKDLNASIIIEDDFVHILDCASSGIKVLVYNTLWNQGELPIGATRVLSWNQILDAIESS
jgi:uncharacterized HAD superfamily protein